MEKTVSSFIIVPHGWQRLVDNGRVIYISPDGITLHSSDEVLRHLTSAGTCKCGLRCPFKIEETFNFDPTILGLPDNMPFTTNQSSSCCVKPNLNLHKVKRQPIKRVLPPVIKNKTITKSSSKTVFKSPKKVKSTTTTPTEQQRKVTSINLIKSPSRLINPVQTSVSLPVINLQALLSAYAMQNKASTTTTMTNTSISIPTASGSTITLPSWLRTALQQGQHSTPNVSLPQLLLLPSDSHHRSNVVSTSTVTRPSSAPSNSTRGSATNSNNSCMGVSNRPSSAPSNSMRGSATNSNNSSMGVSNRPSSAPSNSMRGSATNSNNSSMGISSRPSSAPSNSSRHQSIGNVDNKSIGSSIVQSNSGGVSTSLNTPIVTSQSVTSPSMTSSITSTMTSTMTSSVTSSVVSPSLTSSAVTSSLSTCITSNNDIISSSMNSTSNNITDSSNINPLITTPSGDNIPSNNISLPSSLTSLPLSESQSTNTSLNYDDISSCSFMSDDSLINNSTLSVVTQTETSSNNLEKYVTSIMTVENSSQNVSQQTSTESEQRPLSCDALTQNDVNSVSTDQHSNELTRSQLNKNNNTNHDYFGNELSQLLTIKKTGRAPCVDNIHVTNTFMTSSQHDDEVQQLLDDLLILNEGAALSEVTQESIPNALSVSNISESIPNALSVSNISESIPNALSVSNISESIANTVSVSNISESIPNALSVSNISESIANTVSVSDISESIPNALSVSDISESIANTVSVSDISESIANTVSVSDISESIANTVSVSDISESIANTVNISESIANTVSVSNISESTENIGELIQINIPLELTQNTNYTSQDEDTSTDLLLTNTFNSTQLLLHTQHDSNQNSIQHNTSMDNTSQLLSLTNKPILNMTENRTENLLDENEFSNEKLQEKDNEQVEVEVNLKKVKSKKPNSGPGSLKYRKNNPFVTTKRKRKKKTNSSVDQTTTKEREKSATNNKDNKDQSDDIHIPVEEKEEQEEKSNEENEEKQDIIEEEVLEYYDDIISDNSSVIDMYCPTNTVNLSYGTDYNLCQRSTSLVSFTSSNVSPPTTNTTHQQDTTSIRNSSNKSKRKSIEETLRDSLSPVEPLPTKRKRRSMSFSSIDSTHGSSYYSEDVFKSKSKKRLAGEEEEEWGGAKMRKSLEKQVKKKQKRDSYTRDSTPSSISKYSLRQSRKSFDSSNNDIHGDFGESDYKDMGREALSPSDSVFSDPSTSINSALPLLSVYDSTSSLIIDNNDIRHGEESGDYNLYHFNSDYIVPVKRMREIKEKSVSPTSSSSSNTLDNQDEATDITRLIVSISRQMLPHVTRYRTLKCSTKSLQIGDIVWAKANLLPIWPGQVIAYNEWKCKLKRPKEGQVWVKWFNAETVSLVEISDTKPLTETTIHRSKSNKATIAVRKALKALKEKEEKEI